MNRIPLVLASLLGLSRFGGCGSQSSDIPGISTDANTLPPCPDSPNCIRISKRINAGPEAVLAASETVIHSMNPAKIVLSQSNFRIESVFKVFFFRDDMTLQLQAEDSPSTILHIRSASRKGYTDLGVNRRRVKRFLNLLAQKL